MTRSIAQSCKPIGFGLLLSMASCLYLTAQTPAPPTVNLSPGADIQAAVTAAPAGTTFVLAAGLYRMQRVQPKNGDIFNGQGSVVLNGSEILSFQLDPAGSGLWVANASVNLPSSGYCQKTYPLCGFPQDLFIDNVLQIPVDSAQGLKSGNWFFDHSKGIVYLSGNPAGHLVELGGQRYAFFGGASNVQINNLIVEKFCTPAQQGAIGGDASGTGWVVNKVESRWNHGRGISLGSGSQILNSFIHHNGQLGIGLKGENSKAIKNEISWNNYAGFSLPWEAGGSKFWATTNLLVQSNYVHDNNGPGLWTDFNNVGTVYDSNTVTNNLGEGITHEISFNATIRNNIVKGNGKSATVWLWHAQISIQNSSNVEVYGNTVEVPVGGGNGIVIINQKRGAGTLGPWVAANNYVHGNTITHLGPNGASGFVDDTHGNNTLGNRFDFDHYIVPNTTRNFWQWSNGENWLGFKAAGEEQHGTCCK
jgi:hypothetical protein